MMCACMNLIRYMLHSCMHVVTRISQPQLVGKFWSLALATFAVAQSKSHLWNDESDKLSVFISFLLYRAIYSYMRTSIIFSLHVHHQLVSDKIIAINSICIRVSICHLLQQYHALEVLYLGGIPAWDHIPTSIHMHIFSVIRDESYMQE